MSSSSTFTSRKNKKAQSELIGLVIIVIMITLGILFLAKFALQETPEKKIFTRKGLAYSTMSATLKTQVACEEPSNANVKELSIGKELIDDCAKNIGIIGDSRGSYNECSGMHSCVFLETEVTKMLNTTLGTWQKEYLFRSTLLQGESSKTLFEVKGKDGCIRAVNRDSSGLFPIFVTNVGLVENVLYLCD